MRIELAGRDALRVTAARPELSALVAGARMALRLLEEDPAAPPEAREGLAGALAEWDRALQRADRTGD